MIHQSQKSQQTRMRRTTNNQEPSINPIFPKESPVKIDSSKSTSPSDKRSNNANRGVNKYNPTSMSNIITEDYKSDVSSPSESIIRKTISNNRRSESISSHHNRNKIDNKINETQQSQKSPQFKIMRSTSHQETSLNVPSQQENPERIRR